MWCWTSRCAWAGCCMTDWARDHLHPVGRTFIPLETRTAIANKAQADLFISIHANSSPDASARGVETTTELHSATHRGSM